jgi:hypothetical protein
LGNHRRGSSANGLLQAGEWFDNRFQNFAPHFNGRLKIKILKDGVVDGGISVSNAPPTSMAALPNATRRAV